MALKLKAVQFKLQFLTFYFYLNSLLCFFPIPLPASHVFFNAKINSGVTCECSTCSQIISVLPKCLIVMFENGFIQNCGSSLI